ncbi:DUF3800 domain-containing protein [Kitasatospora cheerisanensis]|nr:DUF3800 domain-containing protein [Kitasatospora cheerisanensis]
MLLTYVDESYSDTAYYIAALLCPDTEAISLAKALDKVVAEAACSYDVPAGAELHGHDIFQAKGHWKKMGPLVRARIGVYNGAFQAVADHDVKIIIRGVDLAGLQRRYGDNHDAPHSIVLTHLLERVEEYARSQNEFALMIADEVPGQDGYRDELAYYKSVGTWGYRAKQLTRIVDTMHFAPSRASRLVQAADLIAYLHRRISSQADVDDRARRANEKLWERIQPKVQHSLTWYP